MIHWSGLHYKYQVHDDLAFDFDKIYNNERYANI